MKKSWIENAAILAVLVFVVAFSGYGCQAIGLMPTQPSADLTPEQIEAYAKAGAKVYKCFTLAGPPPAGGVSGIIMPRDDATTVKFLPGCHIMMQ